MSSHSTRIQQLNSAGQSIWFDFIERSMVQSGQLSALVNAGVTGVTSNPTIFEQAMTRSDAYQADLQQLVGSGKSSKEIYESLAIADIQAAADVLRPVYESTNREDGYVSIEVAPTLANDTAATIAEARRLWEAVDRNNVMIKVPATKPGIEAIRQLISEGINVNVTLIFSLERYSDVKEAYIQGLERRMAGGQPLDHVASVASFFVSRVDVKIDALLEERNKRALMGQAAIANAKLAYAQFQEKFGISTSSVRWQLLADTGAQMQRPLWASTGTKNPAYSDVLYVEKLIGPYTVNTMPPKTLDAFQDHGLIERTIDQNVDDARAVIRQIRELGISMEEVTDELEIEGVQKFADSFVKLLNSIETRKNELLSTV